MQVFFVISGYFSYMLFLRYPLKRWWKVRVERVGIPMLTAIPLLTLPQFIMLQYVKGKQTAGIPSAATINTTRWHGADFPSVVLLVLVVLTTLSMWVFTQMKHRLTQSDVGSAPAVSMTKLTLILQCWVSVMPPSEERF